LTLFQYRKNIEIVGKYRCKKNVRNSLSIDQRSN